jgi:hypothetical protein
MNAEKSGLKDPLDRYNAQLHNNKIRQTCCTDIFKVSATVDKQRPNTAKANNIGAEDEAEDTSSLF